MLFISHKIAGPLYKFEMIARQIGSGNLQVNTNLRRLDQLKDLSIAFNDMTTGLREKIIAVKNSAKQVEDNLDNVVDELGDKPVLEELKNKTQQLKESVESFKVLMKVSC